MNRYLIVELNSEANTSLVGCEFSACTLDSALWVLAGMGPGFHILDRETGDSILLPDTHSSNQVLAA